VNLLNWGATIVVEVLMVVLVNERAPPVQLKAALVAAGEIQAALDEHAIVAITDRRGKSPS
jgi:hypothetical protein